MSNQVNNTIGWGQAAANNSIGYGQGAENNSTGWGGIHADTWGHPETNLTGEYYLANLQQFGTVPAWWRADEVVLSGSNVSTWTDKSGNGRNLLTSASSQRPSYNASDADFNGRPSLTFDGSTDFFNRLTVPGVTIGTLVIVCNGYNGNTLNSIVSFDGVGAFAASILAFGNVGAGISGETVTAFKADTASDWLAISTAPRTTPLSNIICASYSRIAINGVTGTVVQDNVTGSMDFDISVGLRIGLGQYFTGKIAEIIAYEEVLSEASCLGVQNMLNTRYNTF